MSAENGQREENIRPGFGLSSRILLLAIGFILIGEILIFIPSIARFRLVFLEERIAASHIAVIPTVSMTSFEPDPATADKLLGHAGVLAITLRDPEPRIMLGSDASVETVYDLRNSGVIGLIMDAFSTLAHGGNRVVKVINQAPMEPGTIIEVLVDEAEIWREMRDYAVRILTLTLVLSVIVGLFIFLSLRWMIVAPLKGLTRHIANFRDRPDSDFAAIPHSLRRDEIGIVRRALRDMQTGVRQSLRQKTRLAGLGEAVSKISHDLRNILSSAVLVSDRLEASADPEVQKLAPRLIESLNRAIRLSNTTLEYAKSGLPALSLKKIDLKSLIVHAASDLLQARPDIAIDWEGNNQLTLHGDSDQLARAFGNLLKNAADAMPDGGVISVEFNRTRRLATILIKDQGSGIPDPVRERLFEPFASSSKSGGSGLGLAITREILRAHSGDIDLQHTGPNGTVFVVKLPLDRG